MQESIKPVETRDNKKGKKYNNKARAEQKAKDKGVRFPLRQMEMGTELLQYCNHFFADFDFLLMLFHYSSLMLVALLCMKLVVPAELTQTNLTFYMTCITLGLVMANLRHGCFPAGYTKLTDETKMQLLFAIKSFILVWVSFVYSEGAIEQFLGLNV